MEKIKNKTIIDLDDVICISIKSKNIMSTYELLEQYNKDKNILKVIENIEDKENLFENISEDKNELFFLIMVNKIMDDDPNIDLFPSIYDYTIDIDNQKVDIIEEKATEGSLDVFLKKYYNTENIINLPYNMYLSFSIRLLIAIYILHEHGIYHRDLLGNVLISKCDYEYRSYYIKNKVYDIPTFGYRIIIHDFGNSGINGETYMDDTIAAFYMIFSYTSSLYPYPIKSSIILLFIDMFYKVLNGKSNPKKLLDLYDMFILK